MNKLTAEELLLPRYKVIADYPGNIWEIGAVFVSGNNPYWDRFPAIFKKLEWWEERIEDEMPEYLKNIKSSKIQKVVSYYDNANIVDVGYSWATYIKDFLPSTETEYNNQKAKQ